MRSRGNANSLSSSLSFSAVLPSRAMGPGDEPWSLLGCYHPSQQNTFTGRLTEAMIDEVLVRARELIGADAVDES